MKKIEYSPIVGKLLTHGVLAHDDDHHHEGCGHDHHHHHEGCGHDHDHDHHHHHEGCGHDHDHEHHHHHEGCGHDHDHHHHRKEWDNYLELGLKKEHIPELIKMLLDSNLYFSDNDETETWAPIHALRALGQLQAADAVVPILKMAEKFEEDDFIIEDGIASLSMIGSAGLKELGKALHQSKRTTNLRIICCEAIVRIGMQEIDSKGECIKIFSDELKKYLENTAELNGFVVGALMTLEAKESFPLMKIAFEKNCVAEYICGDIEDVEVVFGLRKKRATEPSYGHFPNQEMPVEEKPTTKEIGRNDACPCGSGKKYKKCCLNS